MTFLAQSQISQPELFHCKKIIVTKHDIQVHNFSIQKTGFKIMLQDSLSVPSTDYQMNFVTGQLHLKNFKAYQSKSITIYYLEYPKAYRKVYKKYDYDIVKQDSLHSIKLLPEKNTRNPKPLDGLKTQGSITRGFSAGNNQSLVMQSGLDLKIEGQLSDKLKVKAVLNDDNLPQAYAGISQSYKEFNRIYLQLFAPNWSATGGDLLLDEQSDYFLKFQRKAQGLSVQIGQKDQQLKVTGGIIDGQFGINRFKGIDGNQGPYTLKGNQGENYIFIIPDSDKVYVNGQLLKRGLDQDYIINYDTAELRFNPTFPITSNQRIVVEFNYTNQHYVRYLNFNRYRHQNDKSSWSVFSFIETDAKNQTLLYDLTPEQVEALKNAGDNVDELWIEAAKPASFDENKILYKKVQNGSVSYYQYTNQDEPDLYEVKFSFAGQNKGSYQISQVTAIGKIYEYIGSNQGDYEPKIKLTPPVSKKFVGVNYRFNPNTKTDLFVSGIINHTDQNLFSKIDDQNDIGGAFHLKWDQNIFQKAEKNIRLLTKYDYVDANFTPLDPYRPVEF
ncbi:MAG TPA: hypothetical protein ENK64_00500, partial [Flavobacteriales bacterium]|nr:hypothetical protein [Flavobacteriales bacterium]